MTSPKAELAKPLVTDIGHVILQVGNMDQALQLYRDVLGFELLADRSSSPVWKVIKTKRGELTLLQAEKLTPLVLRDGEDTPLTLHVASFEEAMDELEKRGYNVQRQNKHSGTLVDPWNNLIGLHDHLEG